MAKAKAKIIKKKIVKKIEKKTIAAKKTIKVVKPKGKEKAKPQVVEEILMQPPRGMREERHKAALWRNHVSVLFVVPLC